VARQYHFEFPSDEAARRFAHLVVSYLREDVAILRLDRSVIVVDGLGGRREQLLELSIRVAG
jgi:hypothetical protein